MNNRKPVFRRKPRTGLTRGPKQDRLIRRFCKGYLGFDIHGLISEWRRVFNHVVKHEGKLQAAVKAKTWYTLALRKASGIKFEPLPFTKSDKEGFPKVLTFVKTWLEDSNLQRRRAALTVMQLYQLYDVKGRYSLKSITTPPRYSEYPERFLKNYDIILDRMFPSNQLDDRIYSIRSDFHLSGKNGPNGPMLGTAFVDREAIKNTSIEQSINRLASLTQNYDLMGLLQQTGRPCEVFHDDGRKPCHSRIRIKYEPGGKCRPFAIVDFFSQSALKGIHNFLMDFLGTMPQDGTKSHSDAAKAVQNWTRTDTDLWSFDLTAATDRWPLFLIHRMMEKALGQEIADEWRNVISNRDFIGPSGEVVRWECGQPLGALSSWAAFAVSHHAFVQTCERLDWLYHKSSAPRSRIYWRKPSSYYRMIGDDITIARYKGIAARYQRYLRLFGLDISLGKSVLPSQYTSSSAELAKRVYVDGSEITPVPPNQILEYSKPFGIRALLESCLNRGYQSAGSPFTVQSTHLSRDEWRLLTFPFRNDLPQLNGVKYLYPRWKETENAPAGLNPNWFFWFDTPEDVLRSHLYDYIIQEACKAEADSNNLIRSLSFQTGPVSGYLEKLPQGGDWQPGPQRCRPQIILTVLRGLSQRLVEIQFEFRDPDLVIEDLYTKIGSFHLFLEPRLLVFGRNSKDQKQRTRVFMSKVVKYCQGQIARAPTIGVQ